MSIISEIANLIHEKDLDAAIITESEASRHILENYTDEDYGLNRVVTLNLGEEKRLTPEDIILLTADATCYLITPHEWKGLNEYNDGIIKIKYNSVNSSIGKTLLNLGDKHEISKCGFESRNLNVSLYLDIIKESGFDLIDVGNDAWERARRKHNPKEIEKIIHAQRIAEEALEELLPKIIPGAKDIDLKHELVGNMIKRGASAPSCALFCSGKGTGEIHAYATPDKKIEKGDIVVIDFGAIYENYNSDMTRTFIVGKPTDEQKFHYNLVLEAQNAAYEAFKVGAMGKDVHNAAKAIFAREGLDKYFTHGLGHNVGNAIHEKPSCSEKSEDIMETGHIMTIEPGIYFEGKYGIRIEDMAYLSPEGKINLTKAPKRLEDIILTGNC
ncbi:MAG: M24 family metallopeptidase [Lachnospiraceae bacterium]|jgi:Xaa-Pro aminopeptidase|nr:M24 family metallopeptidase [Lachnospiraceae bacterium]